MAFQLGANAVNAIIDKSSQANIQIDGPHHELHEGGAFSAFVYDADLDSTESINITFKTPNSTSYLHIVGLAGNSVESLLSVLEAPTITANTGTDAVAYNRRRVSSFTSLITSMATVPVVGSYTRNATITNDGTVLWQELVGGGAGANSSFSSSRGTQEWILKPNTIYSFRLTGLVDNGTATIDLNWYAHPDAITPENG